MLKKLDYMEDRGFPSQYKEFRKHYNQAIDYYLLWQNTASDEYANKYFDENHVAADLFNKVSIEVKFVNKTS